MRRIGGAIVLGFLALLCVLVVPVWERGWTCVVCRMERIDSRILGVAQSNFRPNECSRWYAEHVEPSHAHAWARMAGETGRNLLAARKLLESLADARPRGVSVDEDRRHLAVQALREWEARGFPGTWDECWGAFLARHIREREDLAAWLDSGTDLDFRDWRERRKTEAE